MKCKHLISLKKGSLDMALHIESKWCFHPTHNVSTIEVILQFPFSIKCQEICSYPQELSLERLHFAMYINLSVIPSCRSYHEFNDVRSNWSDFLNHIQIRCWSHWNQDSSFFSTSGSTFQEAFTGLWLIRELYALEEDTLELFA